MFSNCLDASISETVNKILWHFIWLMSNCFLFIVFLLFFFFFFSQLFSVWMVWSIRAMFMNSLLKRILFTIEIFLYLIHTQKLSVLWDKSMKKWYLAIQSLHILFVTNIRHQHGICRAICSKLHINFIGLTLTEDEISRYHCIVLMKKLY